MTPLNSILANSNIVYSRIGSLVNEKLYSDNLKESDKKYHEQTLSLLKSI